MSRTKLPLIESCEGCGACCLEMDSPPLYGVIKRMLDTMSLADLVRGHPLYARDARRFMRMPAAVRTEFDILWANRVAENTADEPCFWLDLETRQCRHYRCRPSICRDELKRGDESCRSWRDLWFP